MSATPSCCPHCGSAELRLAHPFRSRSNPWAFVLGGPLLAVLWGASRREEMRCNQCDAVFEQSTRGSRVLFVVLLGVILLTALGIMAEVFDWVESEGPSPRPLPMREEVPSRNPQSPLGGILPESFKCSV